jgi:two-component system, sensor histidine kinase and response regulator
MRDELQDPRLAEIEECLLRAISGDLSARAEVSDVLDGVDGIATGVNILVEELQLRLEELRDATAKAEASNLAKRQFLASMSHEIRTPMNGVIGMVSLLELTRLRPEQQEYVRVISGSSQSLIRLINDILDFSKIESSRLSLELSEFSLYEVVEDVLVLMYERAWEKGLSISCVFEPKIDSVFLADNGRIRQILLNLLGNSLKFTRTGGVTIRAFLESETAEIQHVRMEVTDTGIGVAPDDLAQIFKSFVQVDSTSSREFGGSGLGLAISQQLVDLMGGKMGVESGPGVGSSFWFRLPLTRLQNTEGQGLLGTVQSVAGKEVDLIAQDESLADALTMQMEAWGMEVRHLDPSKGGAALVSAPARLCIVNCEDSGALELAIELASQPGSGSRFLCIKSPGTPALEDLGLGEAVLLPLQHPVRPRILRRALDALDGEGDVDTEKPLSSPAKIAMLSGKVLVVEDNPDNQRVLERILNKLGCTSVLANNGREAIEKWRKESWDIILMDCQMPGMDGFEASSAIRKEEAGQKRTPIVAVTAGAAWEDRQRSLDSGMDDYLAKPITAKSLSVMLARWLVK